MIVVEATVWPHAAPPDSEYAKRIVEAQDQDLTVLKLIIVNDATGRSDIGNYDVYDASEWNGGKPSTPMYGAVHVGRIEGFPRGRKQSHAPGLVTQAVAMVAAFKADNAAVA